MADFAIWVSACENALGVRTGDLVLFRLTKTTARTARVLTLESSLLYEPLSVLAMEGFNGTTSELLICLNAIASEAPVARAVGLKSQTRLAMRFGAWRAVYVRQG